MTNQTPEWEGHDNGNNIWEVKNHHEMLLIEVTVSFFSLWLLVVQGLLHLKLQRSTVTFGNVLHVCHLFCIDFGTTRFVQQSLILLVCFMLPQKPSFSQAASVSSFEVLFVWMCASVSSCLWIYIVDCCSCCLSSSPSNNDSGSLCLLCSCCPNKIMFCLVNLFLFLFFMLFLLFLVCSTCSYFSCC